MKVIVYKRYRNSNSSPVDQLISFYVRGYIIRTQDKTRMQTVRITEHAGRLDKTRQTGNRQTENTGVNTLGIMGKMDDTWRGGWRQTQGQVKQVRV